MRSILFAVLAALLALLAAALLVTNAESTDRHVMLDGCKLVVENKVPHRSCLRLALSGAKADIS